MGRKAYSGCSWTLPCNPGQAALANASINVYAPTCGLGSAWCGFTPSVPVPCLPAPPCPFPPCPFPPFNPYMMSQGCIETCDTDFVGLSANPVTYSPLHPASQRFITVQFTEVRDTTDDYIENSLFISSCSATYKIQATVPILLDEQEIDPDCAYASLSLIVNGLPLYTTPEITQFDVGCVYALTFTEYFYLNKGDIASIMLNLGEDYNYIISPGNSTRIFSGCCGQNCSEICQYDNFCE